MKLTPVWFPVLLISIAAGLGCQGDRVESVRVEKTPSPETAPAPVPGPPTTPNPHDQGAQQTLAWDLPSGWTSEPAGGMRFATLKPSATGKAEVSVVTLAGTAGGELANVNRWRSQLGMPPIEEAGLASVRKVVNSKAGAVSVYEFTQSGNRMVVGLLASPDGSTWFLKLVGEDAPVNQAKAGFLKLLGSLRLG